MDSLTPRHIIRTISHQDQKVCYDHITRMVWLSAFGRPDSLAIGPKHYASSLCSTYQNFVTTTAPAIETNSMGLPADAPVSRFLQSNLQSTP